MLLFNSALLLALQTSAAASAPVAAPLDVLAALEIAAGELHRVDVDGNVGREIEFEVELEGSVRRFELTPVDNRAPGYRLIVQQPDGQFVDAEPGPTNTYRGFSKDGEFKVWAGFDGDYLTATFESLDSGIDWDIVPHRDADSVFNHVVYDALDDMAERGVCELFEPEAVVGSSPAPLVPYGGGTTPLMVAELAIDCDFQFYQSNNSSVAANEADVMTVINRVNDDHYNDANQTNDPEILHVITAIVVRTSNDDPYSTLEPSALLGQVGAAWSSAFFPSIPRDHVELFTGKNLNGSVIGVAWLGGICTGNGQSVVQSMIGGPTSRASLTSHEIGHNWGSAHCSGSSCHIMCPGLNGCGGLGGDFGPFALAEINAGKEAKMSCLTDPGPGGGVVPPAVASLSPAAAPVIAPEGASITLNGSGFTGVNKATLDGVALTLFPAEFAVLSDSAIEVYLDPTVTGLGTHTLVVENNFGSDSVTFDVVFNDSPALSVTGSSSGVFFTGDTAVIRVASQANDLAYLYVSTSTVPSALPGLVAFDIGNNFSELVPVVNAPIDPLTGWFEIAAPVAGLPPLSTFYLQAAIISASAPALPVEVTNVGAGAFII